MILLSRPSNERRQTMIAIWGQTQTSAWLTSDKHISHFHKYTYNREISQKKNENVRINLIICIKSIINFAKCLNCLNEIDNVRINCIFVIKSIMHFGISSALNTNHLIDYFKYIKKTLITVPYIRLLPKPNLVPSETIFCDNTR